MESLVKSQLFSMQMIYIIEFREQKKFEKFSKIYLETLKMVIPKPHIQLT